MPDTEPAPSPGDPGHEEGGHPAGSSTQPIVSPPARNDMLETAEEEPLPITPPGERGSPEVDIPVLKLLIGLQVRGQRRLFAMQVTLKHHRAYREVKRVRLFEIGQCGRRVWASGHPRYPLLLRDGYLLPTGYAHCMDFRVGLRVDGKPTTYLIQLMTKDNGEVHAGDVRLSEVSLNGTRIWACDHDAATT